MQEHRCEYRKVSDDGRIICSKIVLGDNAVSAHVCRDCPAKACDCERLRFSLQKASLSPIIVRWGNGHVEIWDDQAPAVSFLHSACETKTIPISSPKDCIGCPLREGSLPQVQIQPAAQEASLPALRSFDPSATLRTSFAEDRAGSGQTRENVIPFVKAGV